MRQRWAREERTGGNLETRKWEQHCLCLCFLRKYQVANSDYPSCSDLSLHTFNTPQILMDGIQFYSEAGQSPPCLPFPGYKIGTPILATILPPRKPAWFLYESSEKDFYSIPGSTTWVRKRKHDLKTFNVNIFYYVIESTKLNDYMC